MSASTPARPQPLRSIVAATDFSPAAEKACAWALGIAQSHGAALHVVHGLLLPNAATDFLPTPPDLTVDLEEAARERLAAAAAHWQSDEIEVTSEVRIGIASQAILEAAEERRADLLVLGTRGLTGVAHLLLGSTAQRVVQHARCPVLTVHADDRDRRSPVAKILVPTDFSRDAQPAEAAAERLLRAELEHQKLVLVHAYHMPFEYTAYGTIPTSLHPFEDVAGAAEERLEEIARPLRARGVDVETVAREGYPPDVIVEEAKAHGVDLVALGTHGRSGLAHLLLGSTAERVVQQAPCPVLTVRREPDEN